MSERMHRARNAVGLVRWFVRFASAWVWAGDAHGKIVFAGEDAYVTTPPVEARKESPNAAG